MRESIVSSLERIVEKYPNKIAISNASTSHSYQQLWSEIVACASYLGTVGVKKGDRVTIFLHNSFQYVATYYGVLLHGGVVVALNTGASIDDIKNWYKHCNATMLVTESDLLNGPESLSEIEKSQIIVMISGAETNDYRFWNKFTNSSHNHVEVEMPDIEDTATIIYTSGTTGNPKGVTLTHANLLANYQAIIKYLELTSQDSIINILPFFYSYGNSVLHTHLLVGAGIYIENSFMYPVKILQKISELGITGFSGVPATYSILLNRTKLEDYDLRSLRYLTQAGGAMPPANTERLVKLLPHVNIFIMYGQTEATARISYLEPTMLTRKLGSIGKPIDGMNVEIRDENGMVVEPNIEGQLYVCGPSIMKGYWGDDKLTDSTLCNKYLKTGDIGYYDVDGYLYLTGRISDMIKVGGNRISPLEIEEVITRLDGVEEVAASGIDDELLGQVVKVSIVRRVGCELTDIHVKAFCRQQLAQYKIPKHIEFVDHLPKTSSGKVKRYLL